MNEPNHSSSLRSPSAVAATSPYDMAADGQLTRILEKYIADLEAGCPPGREELLACYPELAAILEGCLDAMKIVHQIAPQWREESTGDPDRTPSTSPIAVGDFRILRQIGRGGMGVVYEAEQLSLGRRVALKVLPFAAVLDAKQLQRFQNEARAAATLHHPGIVDIYSIGCDRGVHHYAMQLIEGKTLADVIDEFRCLAAGGPIHNPQAAVLDAGAVSHLTLELASGRFAPKDSRTSGDEPTTAYPTDSTPRDEFASADTVRTPQAHVSTVGSTHTREFFRTVAGLGIQAAEALDHAHIRGIVHRDIKPGNFMIDQEGHLWITDFGLARIETDPGLTLTGDVLGTLRYMSPEQALAKRVLVDHRSDIYSLGVTLYELLTLEPAVKGEDRGEILKQIAFVDPRPPRRVRRSIPVDLETIVLKAMCKNPAERYDSAQELADDLSRFIEDKPIQARRPTVIQRVAKWSRRHMLAVVFAAILAGAGAITFAATAVVVARAYRSEALERERADANLRVAREAVDDMYTQVAEQWLAQEPGMSFMRQQFLEKAIKFYDHISKAESSNPEILLQRAMAYQRIGYLLEKIGKFEQSQMNHRRSVASLQGLVNQFPNNRDYQLALADAYALLGFILNDRGFSQGSEKAHRRNVEICQSLASCYPDEPVYQYKLAKSLGNLDQFLETLPHGHSVVPRRR